MTSRVLAAFFSATGTTEKIVTAIAGGIAGHLGLEVAVRDFTLPSSRREPLVFTENDLVVFGTPVYAGRIPNVLLKYLETLEGGNALAVPVALFGNRNYDDALIEIRDLLERKGAHTVAAAAFVGEHSFSTTLGAGRPDAADMAVAAQFATDVAEKINALTPGVFPPPVAVPGVPYPHDGYYMPRDRHGTHIDIRKVTSKVNEDCTDCGLCAEICPMGSINPDNVREYTGICIKCGACIKRCPLAARYYDDEGYLYHKTELEEVYTRRADISLFL